MLDEDELFQLIREKSMKFEKSEKQGQQLKEKNTSPNNSNKSAAQSVGKIKEQVDVVVAPKKIKVCECFSVILFVLMIFEYQ
jgi:hypothetical protein